LSMTEPTFQRLDVNGLQMKVAIQGNGPLVLMCHGFPELWISWRAQMQAPADAGYRAVAPDMRGYGGTTAPADDTAYSLLHLVGDMVELVNQLQASDERQAVIIGHDWGAPVAWNSALLRPDVFRAVVGMSVPFSSPGRVDVLSALRQAGIETFYFQYFQKPGVAEAELERDVTSSIRKIHYNGSGDGPNKIAFGILKPNHGFLDDLIEPETLPSWLTQEDIAYYAEEFSRTGFRGGLNWYRNITRSWELLAPWRDMVIKQPSMFIAGARDDVLKFPNSQAQIANFTKTLPGLRGCHIMEGAGHWIQRERASAVNELLLGFLRGL
jgi:pimeloyl-ACP methyl ester carboxylesterase